MVIGFIGLGNMARALIGGILETGMVSREDVVGSAATARTRERVAKEFGIRTDLSNAQVAAESDVLFLAVKPQYMPVVLEDLLETVRPETILVSIAAGKTTRWISDYFERPVKIVRCMPNTPVTVREGCCALCCNEQVTTEELASVMQLLSACGMAEVVPENLMDAVVGVSGSSPAYVFMFIEAMADAAVRGGMTRKQAYRFAAQAVKGSAQLMLESGKLPAELKDMVCSPAGTTIEAVKVLEEQGFRGTVMDAVDAAIRRSSEL